MVRDLQLLENVSSGRSSSSQDTIVAAFFALVLLISGVILHPVLKLFYAEGDEYGHAKNTLSVVDTALAVVFLLLLRSGRRMCNKNCVRTMWGTAFRQTLLPGLFIFGSIALATWANYESLWAFFTLAPIEIAFVIALSVAWHKVVPSLWQFLAALIVIGGAALLSVHMIQKAKANTENQPPDGWIAALVASLLFRLNQAFATIAIRSACVALRDGGLADVVDISICKISWACLFCIPYALITEGWIAWKSLANARGPAMVYLLLTVVITCIFQTTNVGLNSRLKSVSATMVMQLQPVVQVCLAVLLSDTSLARKLKLQWDGSIYNIVGTLLLLGGTILYLATSRFHRIRDNTERDSTSVDTGMSLQGAT